MNLFDVSKLDEHQLGQLEFVLNSPAYADFFEPYLRSMRDSMNAQMLDRSAQRKEKYPDDFLAGMIIAIDGLLEFFGHVITETSAARVIAAQGPPQPEVQYEILRQAGAVRPMSGPQEDYVVPSDEDY